FCNRSFDERDVREFLIASRDLIPSGSLVRDLADSVAHARRDRGITHLAVDSLQLRLKYGGACVFPDKPRLDLANLGARERAALRHSIAVLSKERLLSAAKVSRSEALELFDQSFVRLREQGRFTVSEFVDRELLLTICNAAANE